MVLTVLHHNGVNKRKIVRTVFHNKGVNKRIKGSKQCFTIRVRIREQTVLRVLHHKGLIKKTKGSNSASPQGCE